MVLEDYRGEYMRINELKRIIEKQLLERPSESSEFQQGYDAALEDILTLIGLHRK